MTEGKKNIVVGLMMLAGFMLYGFVLIYLRDFAPGKEQWIANHAVGTAPYTSLRTAAARGSSSCTSRRADDW